MTDQIDIESELEKSAQTNPGVNVNSTDVYWDPYKPELTINPYPTFKRLREEAPLYYNKEYDFYALSRFDDVQQGLRDYETFCSGKGAILELIKADAEMPNGMFIFEDPPQHTAHRGVLSRVFTPKALAGLEPQIRDFTATCLDALVGTEGFDIIKQFGSVMPMQVIGMMLGIPDEDLKKVQKITDDILRTEEDGGMAGDALDGMGQGFEEYIDWREKNPSDDLMTKLMNEEFVDEHGSTRKLSRDEIVIFVNLLSGAGNETTNRLIGWSAKMLADHPEQRQQLVDDPSLIPQAIEEILRMQPPGPFIARYVTRDVEYYGQTVPAGSVMMFLVGAANRDESRFVNGDSFDINRERKSHLTFGYGVHTCLGSVLARLEGRVALEEFLQRFPNWRCDEANGKLSPTSTVRGWETLPVYFGDKPLPVAKPVAEPLAKKTTPVTLEELAGKWSVTVKGPTGPMVTIMDLEFVNGALTGTQGADDAVSSVENVVYKEGKISWNNQVTKPMKLKTTFNGEVDGDAMSGKVKAGFMGSFNFTAKRIS